MREFEQNPVNLEKGSTLKMDYFTHNTASVSLISKLHILKLQIMWHCSQSIDKLCILLHS